MHYKKRILNSDEAKVKSLIWKEFQSNIHWISNIIFYFNELLILRTIPLKLREYLDWIFFQANDLTFVAYEFDIPFLQCVVS